MKKEKTKQSIHQQQLVGYNSYRPSIPLWHIKLFNRKMLLKCFIMQLQECDNNELELSDTNYKNGMISHKCHMINKKGYKL